MPRKADMSIQMIFLIFIGTIAAVVAIGLISNWALNANNFITDWISPHTKDPTILDNQKVTLNSCDAATTEIIKQAKLCNEYGRQGKTHGLCYALLMPQGGCAFQVSDIQDELTSSAVNYTLTARQNSEKIVISYDFSKYQVSIE